ncbi:MAG: hypothetical protein V4541_05280 [Bacteroidota bacterium]
MQPADHKPLIEKELVAHIKESLVVHEETYVAGAWEKFSATEEAKKKPILWTAFLRGAAAILLLGFVAFLFTHRESEDKHTQILTVKPTKTNPLPNPSLKPDETESLSTSKPFFANERKAIPALVKAQLTIATATDSSKRNETITIVQDQLFAVDAGDPGTPKSSNQGIAPIKKIEQKKPDIIDFLNNETKKNELAQVSLPEDRFTLGLVIAPSFGNSKKLNMGYGISMDYSLSEKISINSGLAYNQMTAGKTMHVPASTTSLVNSGGNAKNLESTEEQIVGVDIPLEIRYHFNKNIYANVGISAFAVIDQKKHNTFVQDKVVQNAPSGIAGPAGPAGSQSIGALVSERTTEKASPDVIGNNSFLGFYNFSVGYRKKISKRNAVSIEPFMKLPMKEVDKESLKLIGTGIKLKFDF